MRYLTLLLLIGLASCVRPGEPYTIMGYTPIYRSAQEAAAVGVENPKASVLPGKIYAWGNYLFQVEQNEGIHIIDNTDPRKARKILFLKVPAASELAVKANHLYTNNLNDLVVFDLANINAPQLVNRVKDAFPQISQEYPPATGVYFDCVDPAKGIVVGWEQKQLDNPQCRR